MLIKFKKQHDVTENDVTEEATFNQRRQLIKQMGFLGAGSVFSGSAVAGLGDYFKSEPKPTFNTQALNFQKAQPSSEILTPEQKVISHNNFYEFGTDKSDPSEYGQNFKVNPWTLRVSGECENNLTLDYNDLFKRFSLEERIYRLRCVEAWSMVVPWIGFSLADLLKQAKPNSKAKYVAFETLEDAEQMPGQASRRIGGGIDYPYVEGLRIDEAMNSLTFMSVGVYGKTLPPQNGAPIRLVVPWKYGFKSIKSIVSIKFVEKMPPTTWNILAPNEYGFYANVNPSVDHPRWSQASERRITKGGLLARNRIETLPFNGYANEVADLYRGMDLTRYF